MKRKQKRRLRKWVYIPIAGFFLGIILFSGLKLYQWHKDNQAIAAISENLIETVDIEEKPSILENTENINPPKATEKEDVKNDYWDYIKMHLLNVNFNTLLEKNSDTVGWIKVNGTNINYPIVQTTDNKYYLTHSYEKKNNSAGWIFADYRNDLNNLSYNTIIYGHGRLDTTMFGSLKNILKSNWYNNKDNHIVKLSTPQENTLWQVFSVYTIEAESYYIRTQFQSSTEFKDFITTLKNRSEVSFNAPVDENDKILTLSTCQDNYGHRVVLHAKLIKVEKRNAS